VVQDYPEENKAEDGWEFSNIALIRLFSPSNEHLLYISKNVIPLSVQLPSIQAVLVQDIISVIAMIPHRPQMHDRVVQDHFFFLEKPGLDLTFFSGNVEVGDDDDDGNVGDVE